MADYRSMPITSIKSGGDITTQGTTLSVEKDATFRAVGDVHFDVSSNRYRQSANSSGKAFFEKMEE